MTPRVLIAGYYGAGNAGDEEILRCLIMAIRKRDAAAEVRVVSRDPRRSEAEHGVAALGWDDTEGQIEAVGWASLVVVGGGGLFQDYWGSDSNTMLTGRAEGMAAYGAPLVLARLLGVPAAVLGTGVGPLNSPGSRQLVRNLAAFTDFFSVRDQASLALALDCGVDQARLHLGADLAFLDVPGRAIPSARDSVGVVRPQLGVALRHWSLGFDQDSWATDVARALDSYHQATGGGILLVPFQEGRDDLHNDLKVATSVLGRMEQRSAARVWSSQSASDDPLAALTQCDLILGMRLHSLIAGMRLGIPVVGLAYDPKVGALLADVGMGEFCVSLGEATKGALAAILVRTVRETEDLGHQLREASASMCRAAEESVDLALSLERAPDLASGSDLARDALGNMARQVRIAHENLNASQSEVEELRRERDFLATDRDRMAYDLGALRESVGVNLVRRYWTWLRRIAPEGSRRRAAYRAIHPILRGGLGFISRSIGLDRTHVAFHDAAFDHAVVHERTTDPSGRGPLDPRFALMQFANKVESRNEAVPCVIVFSATQLIESEGQRPTNLSIEFARSGIPVVFCGWRWDKSAWTVQDRLGEGILQFPMDLAIHDPGLLFRRSFSRPGVVIFEFPHPDLFGVAATAHASGWLTIYDMIDDWEGFRQVRQAPWYREEFERHLLVTSDLVIVVNEALGRMARARGRCDSDCVPNGLPAGIGVARERRLLPRGDLTIGYFGHLTSSWFDWDLVIAAALAQPKWLWHIIGYGEDRGARDLPRNILMLGKVRQQDLASYAANWDVAVIPFRRSRLSAGVDAIKLYEYMAMGLPVVTVGAPVPADAAHLASEATGIADLIPGIEEAARSKEDLREARIAFAAQSTWRIRADKILSLVESGAQRTREKLWLFERGK